MLEHTTDKLMTWSTLAVPRVFKGDDWKGSPTWLRLEADFAAVGVEVVYLPYTTSTSTTILRELQERARAEERPSPG